MLKSVNHKFWLLAFQCRRAVFFNIEIHFERKANETNWKCFRPEARKWRGRRARESKRDGFDLNTLYPHYFQSFENAMLCTFSSDQSIFITNWLCECSLFSFWSKPQPNFLYAFDWFALFRKEKYFWKFWHQFSLFPRHRHYNSIVADYLL